MRIIALMNQKGGVGKTTTTVNLGAALAELGKNVCLIDLDPQAHLTINYGVEPHPDLTTLYNVLVDDKPILDAVMGIDKGISLVPSALDLAACELELVSVLGREMLLKKRIEAALADPSGEWDFDYVLLDCPPSLGLLTLNGLAAASEVIIPMQPHFLALHGVAKLLDTVRLVNKRMNPALKVTGIILTMFDAQTRHSLEILAELEGMFEEARGKPVPWAQGHVFRHKIRRNIKLVESPSFGQHIIQYDPTSNGAADYRAAARELLGMPDAEPRPEGKPAAHRVPSPAAAPAETARAAPPPAGAPTPPAAAPSSAASPSAASPARTRKPRGGKAVSASPTAQPDAPQSSPVEDGPPQIESPGGGADAAA